MRTWYFSNFYFFYFATIGIIMPYWSVYLDYLGFSAKEIGQLMAIFLFTKVLAPNLWAAVADHLTAKHGSSLGILKFATFATVLIYGLMYLANGFWPVAAVMLGYCVFWNASLPQLEAATLNHLKDKRAYGRVRVWGSLGFIVTVVGVGVLMDLTGPSSILEAGGLALLLLFFASLLMTGGQGLMKGRQGLMKGGQGHSASVGVTATVKSSSVRATDLLTPQVLVLLLLCFLMQLSHAPLQAFMSLYLAEYGYSNSQIGLLWAVGVVCEIGVFLIAYKLLSVFKLSSLLTFTFLAAAIRWGLVASFPELPLVVFITQAMHSITFGLYHAVMIQLIDRLFVGAYQIRGQALYSSITFGLGGAIGSYLSGYIWTDIGKQELFLFSGLLMLLVFVVSLFVTPKLTGESSQ